MMTSIYIGLFCVYTCISLELQVKFGDKIQILSTILKNQVQSVIIGRNGRVVLGAYFRTDLAHFLYSRYTILHTPLVWT